MLLAVAVVVVLAACGGVFLLRSAQISALRSFSAVRSHSVGRSPHDERAVTCGDARERHEIIAGVE